MKEIKTFWYEEYQGELGVVIGVVEFDGENYFKYGENVSYFNVVNGELYYKCLPY